MATTPPARPVTAESCAHRAASLLELAESSSDLGTARLVELAGGWRELAVALSRIEHAGND